MKNQSIKMKRSGTTIFAMPNEISRYRKSGFVEVETDEETSEEIEKKKTFSQLNVAELKALANMLNVDVSGKKGSEIKDEIKALELDGEVLQSMIDAIDLTE